MSNSKKYELNKHDLKRIGLGALVAVSGALLTYLTDLIPNVDFGSMTPVVVALWSVIANTVRKLLTDYHVDLPNTNE